ncbi:Alpha/Beta hydrolase protein [Mycena galericulata]|nr:Alpha/Beta hydrolase protein [Mycena galericulata]
MLFPLPLLSLLLLNFSLVGGASPPTALRLGNATVDLGYAQYQGFIDPSQQHQLPGNPLRSIADGPQTPSKITGVQTANAQPPYAATNPFAARKRSVAASEDCLFLKYVLVVHLRPQNTEGSISVYIIGSASGYTGADIYDGNDLIKESGGDAVVVVLQYRLGLFGFLSGSKVKAGGVLNAGLLDQQFALQWIQNHIGLFGGDPNQVTIWGESAGIQLNFFHASLVPAQVLMHMIANGGRTRPPLFKSAITSSLYAPSQYQFNDTVPEAVYADVVAQAGCSANSNTLACLRTVNVDTLVAVNVNISANTFYGTFSMVPVVDGEFITQRPSQAIKEGKLNGNALLSVTNSFEGTILTNPNTTDVSVFLGQLFPRLGSKGIAAAAAQYAGIGTPSFQAAAIMGEAIIICPTYSLLSAFKGPTYKGEFAIGSGFHGSDTAYYFPSSNPSGAPPYNNTAFDTAFSASFLNFAVSGNPNAELKLHETITPTWKTWKHASTTEMLFNNTDGLAGSPVIHPITTSTSLLARCKFWDSISSLTVQ